MIYIHAGVYAEGPTDYAFLLPLLNRFLDEIAAPLFPAAYEVASTTGIDARSGVAGGRAERIAAAMDEYWETCTIFVVHADADGDADHARQHNIDPGVATARSARPDRTFPAAACVPVREIEAWMLADPRVFHDILGVGAPALCPAEPEREIDPKATLRRILTDGGARRPPERLHAFFGERVDFGALRRLPAFQRFEADLVAALHELAQHVDAS